MAAAAERLRPCMNTVSTGVTMTWRRAGGLNHGLSPDDGYRCAQDLRSSRNCGRTADSPPQDGQFGRKGGELDPQLLILLTEWLNLLLLSKDQGYDAGWSCQPNRFWNPGQRCGHQRQSLPEMQAGFMPPSRVQRGGCSSGAVPASERVREFLISLAAWSETWWN